VYGVYVVNQNYITALQLFVFCLCCQGSDTKRWRSTCERRFDQVEKVHLCCTGDYCFCCLFNQSVS